MKHLKKAATALAAAATVLIGSAAAISAAAEWKQIGYMGDLNNDKAITVADLVILTRHLLGAEPLTKDNAYYVGDSYIGINGADGYKEESGYLRTADMNQDKSIDAFDLVLLRQWAIKQTGPVVWQWEEEIVTTTSTTTTAPPETTTTTVYYEETKHIDPPIYDMYGSLPSQGNARVLTFYVDFPDCKFDYYPTTDEIEKDLFGPADPSNPNYPFESVSAFYERSSKGAMKLSGEAYTYTTKMNKSAYEDNVWHIALVNELIKEMDSSVDFSQFDGDGDKVVDAIVIIVPEAAGDDNWWPAAGEFGGEKRNRADGMNIGHVMVGNDPIRSSTSWSGLCETLCHELGHCMGLPDYYLYNRDDFQGMHGSAGFEMMDDTLCDFGAVSKLMLGWYFPEQISVFDPSKGQQTYTLNNAQTDGGNCVIIPCGTLADKYRSEFFIIEYASLDNNNSDLTDRWWQKTGSGVRIYHVEATVYESWGYRNFLYASGNSDATNNDNGRRFIRLVNEGTDSTDNLFYKGDVIGSNISDFRWYDANAGLTVDPNITISVDDFSNDSYTITITPKQ